MDEQQLREIAEAAFKCQFGDIEIVRIDVMPWGVRECSTFPAP